MTKNNKQNKFELLQHGLLTIALLSAVSSNTSATTGYFGIGYGPKSTGMAGTIVAVPQDAMIASKNPAGMGLVA